jgi:hypothetical protein
MQPGAQPSIEGWKFRPVVRIYSNGRDSGVELASVYAGDASVVSRIALMIAAVLPGVTVRPVRDDHVHLVIEIGKYYMDTLNHVSQGLLNERLHQLVREKSVLSLGRHPTLPMLWLLVLNGWHGQRDHERILKDYIDPIKGVAVTAMPAYEGQLIELFIPEFGHPGEQDDDANGASLLAKIAHLLNFQFEEPPASAQEEDVDPDAEEGQGPDADADTDADPVLTAAPISAPPVPPTQDGSPPES